MVEVAPSKVLQKNLHKLASTLDPVVISTALYAEGLVDERVWEEARLEGASYDKCLKVLGALVRGVKASPACFDKFCLILEDQIVTKDIAKELRDELERLKAMEKSIEVKDKIEDEEGSGQGLKRKQEAKNSSTKHKATLKKGKIESDKVLMEIAREIGGKWEEVGVALDIDFKVLRSVVASETVKVDHMKAFYMLHEWKERAADQFTYKSLASALEEAGLNTCSQRFCYSEDRTKQDLHEYPV